MIDQIAIIILIGYLLAMLQRWQEIGCFEEWAFAVINFLKLAANSKFARWILSRDCDELKGWYNYFWRDLYHAMKFAQYCIYFVVLSTQHYYIDTGWLWLFGFVGYGLSQWVWGKIIDLLVKSDMDNYLGG